MSLTLRWGKTGIATVVSIGEVENICQWPKAGSRSPLSEAEHHIFWPNQNNTQPKTIPVTFSQLFFFFLFLNYQQAELPLWMLSSLCPQPAKIRLIRDGLMLALYTLEGTEGGTRNIYIHKRWQWVCSNQLLLVNSIWGRGWKPVTLSQSMSSSTQCFFLSLITDMMLGCVVCGDRLTWNWMQHQPSVEILGFKLL